MRSMNTAPKDGTLIKVRSEGKWWRVRYQDCRWMREAPDGDPTIADAWAIEYARGPGHVELDEAEGWKPVPDEQ